MRNLIVGICLLLPTFCTAGEIYLTIPIASWHSDRQRENNKGSYEQTNPGLGLEYLINDRWRLGAGMYRSSIRTDSGYVGAAYLPLYLNALNIRLGVSVGLVSGYEGNLLPVIVPTAMLEWKRFGVNFMLVPPYDNQPGGIGFVLKWKLN